MDFDTGKLSEVAQRIHPSVTREYTLLGIVLTTTLVPYAIAAYFYPVGTLCVVLFMAYFQVLITLAQSSGTATSHYMRFLLSGSNPIAMTGGSSLLFGAVDAIMDWREDRAARHQTGLLFYLQILLKFALTPIGLVLFACECSWDLLMLRHPRIWRMKWRELFSLARYHDIICPEKSNDVFYADLSLSRYQRDPHLYQWNRMRCFVFELKQCYDDQKRSRGTPESNIFLQSDIAAYQTLKRLRLEEIEKGLQSHYSEHLDEFPFPKHLAERLIRAARPLHHYQTMRHQVTEKDADSAARFGDILTQKYHPEIDVWKVLRLFDAGQPITPAVSQHVTQSDLNALCARDVLNRISDFEFELSEAILEDWTAWLDAYYVPETGATLTDRKFARVPDYFEFEGTTFVRREDNA